MKTKKMICIALAYGLGWTLTGCQPKTTEQPKQKETAIEVGNTQPMNLSDCNVCLPGITFTQALNGGDTCITQKENGALEFRCTEGRDIFSDPNGKLSNNTVPMLLASIDNTKPFTLTAKVTPGFTEEGLYNAADLFVFANDTLWQKLCFEQDERGRHRIVTVRTRGTSDDNNHERLDMRTVYLKYSSDTHTLASYYSLDNKEWHMVRLYKNEYPAAIWVGIASQCPQTGVCTSLFEEVTLTQTAVKDFRLGI